MYDAFDKSRGRRLTSRKLKTKAADRFSPSYGVHKGKIPDPNWPPPEFPEEGLAMQRKGRRIVCDFTVVSGAKKYKVHGDLSKGGALFYLPDLIASSDVTIELKDAKATAVVLGTSKVAKGVAHHARFTDEAEGAKVWEALIHG
jgi:hypothetical protein